MSIHKIKRDVKKLEDRSGTAKDTGMVFLSSKDFTNSEERDSKAAELRSEGHKVCLLNRVGPIGDDRPVLYRGDLPIETTAPAALPEHEPAPDDPDETLEQPAPAPSPGVFVPSRDARTYIYVPSED